MSVAERAAAYLRRIIKSHPLTDGKKRNAELAERRVVDDVFYPDSALLEPIFCKPIYMVGIKGAFLIPS